PPGVREDLEPAHPEPPRRGRGELLDPRLDAFLLFGLRERHVLAVRDHLRRQRQAQRIAFVSARTTRELLAAQPGILFSASGLLLHDPVPPLGPKKRLGGERPMSRPGW